MELSLLFLAALLCRTNAFGINCNPDRFQNEPEEDLDFECPSGSALEEVESCFVTVPTVGGDRQWLWRCKAVSLLFVRIATYHEVKEQFIMGQRIKVLV